MDGRCVSAAPLLFVIYECITNTKTTAEGYETYSDDDGNEWIILINHDCGSHLTYDETTGLYEADATGSKWKGWVMADNGEYAYVYCAEAVYADGTPVTNAAGEQMVYFYYRCATYAASP